MVDLFVAYLIRNKVWSKTEWTSFGLYQHREKYWIKSGKLFANSENAVGPEIITSAGRVVSKLTLMNTVTKQPDQFSEENTSR